MKRYVVLLLAFVLAACGHSTPPPKPADNLVVGKGQDAPLAAAQPAQSDELDLTIPIAESDPVKGSRNAYVTIVLFSDFQCPFCSRLVPTLDRVLETQGQENVRLVFKHNPLPFHDKARPAAEIAAGVMALGGTDAFWRFHDLVFKNQRDMDLPALIRYAGEAGVDSGAIQDGYDRKTWAAKVDADMELAKRLGAYGTPCSFINGKELSGAQPFERFQEIVVEEKEAAKSLVERGVSRDKVYARLLAANYKEKAKRKDPDDDDDDKDREDTKTVWKVPVGSSPVRGNAQALVTIVEFGDFQCPYCKRVQPTLDEVKRAYGDKVRFVWKDEALPFHPRAEPAAHLARFARQQKGDTGFWAAHDALWASQPSLEDSDLEAVAKKLGLDTQKAMAAVKAKTFKKQIDDDASLVDDVQASGTPHFFINGRRLVGAQPVEKFKTIIDEEIKKAEALVKSGTAKTALYDALIKDGKGATEPEKKSFGPPAANAPFRGAAGAKVVIQMASDFQCPFCSRVEGTIAEILKAYPTQVKVVWRDKPLAFHQDAPLAAEAAREAYAQKGNAGWIKMHDLLMANQQQLKRSDLDGYATQAGLDAAKFGKALDARTHKATVDADEKTLADAGVNGTPSFTVGPYYLVGAQPFAKFKKLIDRVIAEPAQPIAPVTKPSAAAAAGAAGLVIKDIVVGKGREVKAGDKIDVHYVGTFTDGKEFDSSRKRSTPFTFTIGNGQVIKGWEQGLLGMKVGGKRKLTIPPDLAYGDKGAGTTIPPKSTLLFEVELIAIQ